MESVSQCSSCNMRKMCVGGVDELETEVGSIVIEQLKLKKGDFLYCEDEEISNVYALKSGHFKNFKITPKGSEQVTSFASAGEMLGFDAFTTERHSSYAQAIEDSELCVISSLTLENVLSKNPTVMQQFNRLLDYEIDMDLSLLMLSIEMTAEQKLAGFIVNLSKKQVERGLSSTELKFKMSRDDLANHLEMTPENLNATMNKFKKNEIIEILNKEMFITDMQALEDMLS
jgi:CRP/FNR family transcriptional regulator